LALGKAAEVLAISPGEFAEMSAANPEVVLELAADGSLILMPSTGSETGGRYGALSGLLWQPLCRRGLRMKLFDSSTGFRLPDNFVLSPYLVVGLVRRWPPIDATVPTWQAADPRRVGGGDLGGVTAWARQVVMQPRPRALGSIASVAADAAPQPAAPAYGRCSAHHWQGPGHGGRWRNDLFHGESVNLEQAIVVWIGCSHGNWGIGCGNKLIGERLQARANIIPLNRLQGTLLVKSGAIHGI